MTSLCKHREKEERNKRSENISLTARDYKFYTAWTRSGINWSFIQESGTNLLYYWEQKRVSVNQLAKGNGWVTLRNNARPLNYKKSYQLSFRPFYIYQRLQKAAHFQSYFSLDTLLNNFPFHVASRSRFIYRIPHRLYSIKGSKTSIMSLSCAPIFYVGLLDSLALYYFPIPYDSRSVQ